MNEKLNAIDKWQKIIANWQDTKAPWLLMSALCFLLLAVAHFVFQEYIHMAPCEQCVYTRFAYFTMLFGGLIAAINPKSTKFKIAGYFLGFWGAIYGIYLSHKLELISIAAHSDDPFGVQGCSTEPTFPLNLPLDKWFPSWFQPTGDCGFDATFAPEGVQLDAVQQWFIDLWSNGWYLYPPAEWGTMSSCTMLSFLVAFFLLLAMFASWIKSCFSK